MWCDKLMPGDRVRNTQHGTTGVVISVRMDEVKILWTSGQRRSAQWTSDGRFIERVPVAEVP